jgi:hypothetical protein
MCDARLVHPDDPPAPSRLLFWAFVASTVGPFACAALVAYARGLPPELSTSHLWRALGEVLLLGLVWTLLLRRHGWSLACITMPLEVADLGRAIPVVFVGGLAYGVATSVWVGMFLGARHAAHSLPSAPLSWSTIVATSIVVPMAEEFVYLGFIANVQRRHGELFAIVPAVAARMAVASGP